MKIEELIEKRNTKLSFRLASHVLFWILSFSSTFILIKYSFDTYRDTPFALLTPLRNVLALILFFYPLMYFAIPRFLKKRRWIFLICSIALLILFNVIFDAISEKLVFHYCESCLLMALDHDPDYVSVIQKSVGDNILFKASNIQFFLQLFSGLILPIAIKTSIGYYHIYTRNLQLEKEKVQLELSFLKAQVNPHFLFNTLNNLYGLVMHERTEKSVTTISRLTDFLRYTLDNANKNNIQLSEEIKLIENYIELEKLRLNYTEVNLDMSVEGEKFDLPPLLFIPLLENAFKYNIDQDGSKINIELRVENNLVKFKVQNNFDENQTTKTHGGLGLKNLEKRLNLYFQNNYSYEVTKKDSVYTAQLNLELK